MSAKQIPENELTELIVQSLKDQHRSGNIIMISAILGDIKQTLTNRGYEIAILNRVTDITWKMVTDGILVPIQIGKDHMRIDHWHLRLTAYGDRVLNQNRNFYYDPDGYSMALGRAAAAVDQTVVQYATEALKCYKQGFIFAAAVMVGAAAEKAILILFESIVEAAQDPNVRGKLEKAMHGTAKMPTIYKYIESNTTKFREKIEEFDPKAHECVKHHVLSLADMIRRQRNEAVHPVNAKADSSEVFLSITSLPTALEVIYRHHAFFFANKGSLVIIAP